jgi:hypothetical protein
MPLAPDQLSQISEMEWEDYYKRLLLFAEKKLRRRRFRVSPDAHDFAASAIEKTLSGRRRWNPEKVCLYIHLCGVIESEMSNLATSLDNKATNSRDADAEAKGEIENSWEKMFAPAPSGEELCIARDLKHKFLKQLPGNKQGLRRLAELLLSEGDYDFADCAFELDIGVEQVYALTKQLKKLAGEFNEREKNYPSPPVAAFSCGRGGSRDGVPGTGLSWAHNGASSCTSPAAADYFMVMASSSTIGFCPPGTPKKSSSFPSFKWSGNLSGWGWTAACRRAFAESSTPRASQRLSSRRPAVPAAGAGVPGGSASIWPPSQERRSCAARQGGSATSPWPEPSPPC